MVVPSNDPKGAGSLNSNKNNGVNSANNAAANTNTTTNTNSNVNANNNFNNNTANINSTANNKTNKKRSPLPYTANANSSSAAGSYRRVSSPAGSSSYYRSYNPKSYYPSGAGKSEYESLSSKRSLISSGYYGRQKGKEYHRTSNESYYGNEAGAGAGTNGYSNNVVGKTSRVKSNPESLYQTAEQQDGSERFLEQPKPSLSVNTSAEDVKKGLDKPLSSGRSTPGYHSGSSYTNPRFSNYGSRKYFNPKYGSASPVEAKPAEVDGVELGDRVNGDSYYPGYAKSYKLSRYYGKPGGQDTYFSSKYHSGYSGLYPTYNDTAYSKFSRPKKYANWYGSVKSGNNSQASSPVASSERDLDSEYQDETDSNHNISSLVNNSDFKKDSNVTLFNKTNDDKQSSDQSNIYDLKAPKGESALIDTEVIHQNIQAKPAEKPEEEDDDDYNIDSDIEIRFDDDEEEDENNEKEDIKKDDDDDVVVKEEEKTVISKIEDVAEILQSDKQAKSESPVPLKKPDRRSKNAKQAPKKQHKKLYINVGVGCVFPLNRLEQKLFDLKNRPRDEMIQHQKYLLQTPVRDFAIYPFYERNLLIHEQVFKPKLLKVFQSSKKQIYYNTLSLKSQYSQYKTIWDTKCEENEKQLVDIYPGYQSQLFDNEFKQVAEPPVEEKQSSTSRRSRHHIADSVTSEAEFEKILQQIKMNDPLYKAEQHAAVIPNMIMDPVVKYSKHFINVNNLVVDKTTFVKRLVTDPVDTFNKQEHQLFVDAYVAHPKKFGKISQLMGGLRTPEECVNHYYNTKRTVHYKQLVSNKRNRKTTAKKRTTKNRRRAEDKLPAQPETSRLEATKVEVDDEKSKLIAEDEVNETSNEIIKEVSDGKKLKRKVESTEPIELQQEIISKPEPLANPVISQPIVEAAVQPTVVNESITQPDIKPVPKQVSPIEPPAKKKKVETIVSTENYAAATEKLPITVDKGVSHSKDAIQSKDTVHSKDDVKKTKTVSSYWSVADIGMFPGLLQKYGTQWDNIAKELGTKTTIMVRNYFAKNADKEGWRQVAERVDREREEQGMESLSKVVMNYNTFSQSIIDKYKSQAIQQVLQTGETVRAPLLGYFFEKPNTQYAAPSGTEVGSVLPSISALTSSNVISAPALAPVPDIAKTNSTAPKSAGPALLGTFSNETDYQHGKNSISNLINDREPKNYRNQPAYGRSNIASVLNNNYQPVPYSQPQAKADLPYTASPRQTIQSLINLETKNQTTQSPKTSIANLIDSGTSTNKKPTIMNLLNNGTSPNNDSHGSRSTTPVSLPPLSSFSTSSHAKQQTDKPFDASRSLLSFKSTGTRSILNHSAPQPLTSRPLLPSVVNSLLNHTKVEDRRLPSLSSSHAWNGASYSSSTIPTSKPHTSSNFDTLLAAAAAYGQQSSPQPTTNTHGGDSLSEYHLTSNVSSKHPVNDLARYSTYQYKPHENQGN